MSDAIEPSAEFLAVCRVLLRNDIRLTNPKVKIPRQEFAEGVESMARDLCNKPGRQTAEFARQIKDIYREAAAIQRAEKVPRAALGDAAVSLAAIEAFPQSTAAAPLTADQIVPGFRVIYRPRKSRNDLLRRLGEVGIVFKLEGEIVYVGFLGSREPKACYAADLVEAASVHRPWEK